MLKLLVVNICILVFCAISFAKEIITPKEAAERYLNSELVIIGNVFKIAKQELKDSVSLINLAESYSFNPDIYSVDIYYVKLDSILKGSYKDSVITIFSKPYIDVHSESNDRNKNTETFSTYREAVSAYVKNFNRSFRGGAGEIYKIGKYIILINKKENYYISSLAIIYADEKLLFFKEVAKGDSLFLKKLENDLKIFY